MRRNARSWLAFGPIVVLAVIAGGCGNATKPPASTGLAPTAATAAPPPATTTTAGQGSAALTAEASQAAAGDIPDNQVFLTLRNNAERYSIRYPEGWAQRGTGAKVTFQDKNNLVRVETLPGARPAQTGVTADLNTLRRRSPSLSFSPPVVTTIHGRQIIKVTYSTKSAPNPVTDKRVTLVVDRYYVPGPAKYAIIDLGTPQGVDNIDAYKLMIESFRWM